MMRRLYYIFIPVLILGCAKKGLITYDEGAGIYFDNRNIFLDTINVSWGTKNSEIQEQSITLEVKLFGKVSDVDRPFKIAVKNNPEDTLQAVENIDYKPFSKDYFMPKGEASAFIKVDLLRNPILQTENRILTIELQETEELKFLYSRRQTDSLDNVRLIDAQRVIKMNENFPRPAWWLLFGDRIFGRWSLKKQILICDLMGIDREKWIGNLGSDPNFTEGYLRFCGVKVHRWLQEQKANGNTQYEDDMVTEMEMGPDSRR